MFHAPATYLRPKPFLLALSMSQRRRSPAACFHQGMTSPLNPQNVPEFERFSSSILAVIPATDSDASTKPELPVILVRTHPAQKHDREEIVLNRCQVHMYVCCELATQHAAETQHMAVLLGRVYRELQLRPYSLHLHLAWRP